MDLTTYRAQLDALDKQLVQLFAQRMALSVQIGQYKKEHNLPILQEAREREKLLTLTQAVPPELRDDVRALYTLLFELSRAKQEND